MPESGSGANPNGTEVTLKSNVSLMALSGNVFAPFGSISQVPSVPGTSVVTVPGCGFAGGWKTDEAGSGVAEMADPARSRSWSVAEGVESGKLGHRPGVAAAI